MEDITLERIIHYILGELPEEEMKQLDQQVKTDTGFQERIEEAQSLLNGIHRAGEKEVEESVKSFHREYRTQPEFERIIEDIDEDEKIGQLLGGIEIEEQEFEPMMAMEKAPNYSIAIPEPEEKKIRSISGFTKWIALAATVLLLVVVGISIFRDPGNQKLYASYYSPENEFLNTQMEYLDRVGMASPDLEKRNALKEALNQYNQGNYKTSQESLSEYLKDFPGDSVAMLYLALNKIENKEFNVAIEILKKLISTDQGEVGRLANWYLALTLLKMDKPQEATNYLSIVANDGSNRYSGSARELLQKVRAE